jgi:hypothetical protein
MPLKRLFISRLFLARSMICRFTKEIVGCEDGLISVAYAKIYFGELDNSFV